MSGQERLSKSNSYVLHTCAARLMEKEKLTRPEFEAIF